nr:uncharacterized protein LOC112705366 [Arachis hypogaea]
MEIYVDDMVAKTAQGMSHCDDLKEIFEQIRIYNMRLNPEKCAFGVQGGKFLGFMLTSRGIEANHEKCRAILHMTSPKTKKEVQQLAGRIAALSRFLPAVSSRSYHFFQTISKAKKFQWTEDCEKAFGELKTTLSSPPVLQKPEVVSIKVGPKGTDPCRFHFRANPDKNNRPWELHVDGASSRRGNGAGIILKEGDEVIAKQSLQFNFPASNNQAEYEALITGLKLALNLEVRSLTAHCDSLLVVQQIRGEFQVKDPLLERYWLMAKYLISKFNSFIILHVNREKNFRADILSKLAATRADTQISTLSQLTLEKPSIEPLSVTNITHLQDWRTPFLEYINTGTIPKDELNPQNIRRRASLYTNVAGELYRRGFLQPLLKCLFRRQKR